MKKIYSIRGSLWYMDELTFQEDFEIKRLLAENVVPIESTEFSVVEVIDSLHRSGALSKIFKMILKPYEGPNLKVIRPLFRLWNRRQLKRNNLDPDVLLLGLRNSEIAGIIVDFFGVNGRWLAGYLSSTHSSVWNLEKIPILKDLLYLTNPLYRSPKET